MTVEQNEVKNWLNRAFYADKKVSALESLVKQLRERAQSVSVCYECNDTGKSSSTKNGVENAYMRLVDTEMKLCNQIVELLDIIDEIRDAISKLNDNDLETVMIHRYLLFHTVEETAELLNYSVRATQYKCTKAIKKLCTLLHGIAL